MKHISYSQLIGTIFYWLRTQKNIEQITFSKNINLTQASWSRIENGKAVMNIEQVLLASHLLEIESTYVLNLFSKTKEILEKDNYIFIDSKTLHNKKDIELAPISIVKKALSQHIFSILSKEN